jgi:carboxymethylenebutenolidase
MCFDIDSHPPIPPLAGAAIAHRGLVLEAADGNRFAAFEALPDQPRGLGILVLPDVRGLFTYYEELALRFAEAGVAALAIDYYGRTAGASRRDATFDFATHVPRSTWAGLQGDVRAAAEHLRAHTAVERLFSIGFCYGGRLSLLVASLRDVAADGVIGFYGWPVGTFRNDMPAPADLAATFGSRVLALFGGADTGIPAADVTAFEAALAAAAVDHRVVTYPGAPHSFFDRKAEAFAEASAAAWMEVRAFLGLPAESASG